MSFVQKIKELIQNDRVRNKAYKLCLWSLIGSASYLALNFGKPKDGSFQGKKYL
jgi:hypothetical protein